MPDRDRVLMRLTKDVKNPKLDRRCSGPEGQEVWKKGWIFIRDTWQYEVEGKKVNTHSAHFVGTRFTTTEFRPHDEHPWYQTMIDNSEEVKPCFLKLIHEIGVTDGWEMRAVIRLLLKEQHIDLALLERLLIEVNTMSDDELKDLERRT